MLRIVTQNIPYLKKAHGEIRCRHPTPFGRPDGSSKTSRCPINMSEKKHSASKKPRCATRASSCHCGWLPPSQILSTSVRKVFISAQIRQSKQELFCLFCSQAAPWCNCVFHENVLLLCITKESNNIEAKEENALQHVCVSQTAVDKQHPIFPARFMTVWQESDWMWNWGPEYHYAWLIKCWHLRKKILVFHGVKPFPLRFRSLWG